MLKKEELEAQVKALPYEVTRAVIRAHEEYNGWKNYETWLVNLWITNEESSYEYYRELVRKAKSDGEAAKALKDSVEEGCDEFVGNRGNLYTDLLNGALSSVDWFEVVKALKED
jgi:hypothetical protein